MFAALMAAVAYILSYPPFAIPLSIGTFESAIHFSQLPIFLSGILAGPMLGSMTGAIGGIYMAATKIPFIIVGLAILGYASGKLAKRTRPLFAGILAWCIQAPYVFVTDYIWFVSFLQIPHNVAIGIVGTILIKLTIEALVSSFLIQAIVVYLERTKIIIFKK